MIADLDTLLTALYVELTDRIIPIHRLGRRGPGRPPRVTDAEVICLAVAQVLLRYDEERHWLRAAAGRVGHLFPRLLGQTEYNERLKALAGLMETALRWLAEHTPSSAEALRRHGRHPDRLRPVQDHHTPLGPVRFGPATDTKPPTPATTGE